MNLTAEQYQAVRRGVLKLLRRALGGEHASVMRLEGEDGEVKFVFLAAGGVQAKALSRAVVEVMGNPKATEQWEVPG